MCVGRVRATSLILAFKIVVNWRAHGVSGKEPNLLTMHQNLSPYRIIAKQFDGHRLITENDIFASCGLNSEISVSEMLPLIGLLDAGFTFPDLTDIPDFWRLNRDGVAPITRSAVPSRCVDELILWDAYEMQGASHNVGGTKISKIFHHKYPSKYPLYDDRNI